MKHYFCALIMLFQVNGQGQEAASHEPTNAAEAAAKDKKATQNKIIAEKYQALVSKLPAEEQAWEHVLEANLGGFYFPAHQADKIAGKSNAWDFVKDDPKLPRVLLIGDSISRGYTLAARKALAGKVNLHRAPANCGPTATGLKQLDVWLGDQKWDIIHFNFGIHDRKTPLKEYEERLEKIIVKLKPTGAKLIWASSTPIPEDASNYQPASAILERNKLAAGIMTKNNILIDDLFSTIQPHFKENIRPKDVHFTEAGYNILGIQVAKSINDSLDMRKNR